MIKNKKETWQAVRYWFATWFATGKEPVIRPPEAAASPCCGFLHYRDNDFPAAGLRIDHFLLHPAVASGVERHIRGWGKSSDHGPVWIEIKINTLPPGRPKSHADNEEKYR
ncbi:hypothetical protein [Taibaiella chishuiensis]|uniref:hypothetical protein n=1 Tax=Taibaiella chishuiensis TaxID=1434707 RepID=UPI001FEABBE2|nr:hypothetical protein [Taibaiella chishuiensis]